MDSSITRRIHSDFESPMIRGVAIGRKATPHTERMRGRSVLALTILASEPCTKGLGSMAAG